MLKLKMMILSLFLGAYLLGFSSFAFANDPPLPSPVGRVVWIKGSLQAVMPNNEVRELKKTSVIYEKDRLITGKNSQAQVVFTDNSLMTFREETIFDINEYKFNAKSKSAGKYIMNLIEGGFRTITGLVAKNNPNDYQVNTPVATIGVRGTDYAVYFRKGEMYIGYYEGKPCVTGKKKAETLCLDKDNKYAKVDAMVGTPVPLAMRPNALGPTLEIQPAKISPFSGGGGSQTTQPPKSGTVSNFCIT